MHLLLNQRSKKLRRNNTQAESVLWRMLRNRRLSRYKFRRQYVIEPYIVDFICLHKKLIIELDGEHHEFQKNYDARRTIFLERHGYCVMRFSNSYLFNKDQELLEEIVCKLLVL